MSSRDASSDVPDDVAQVLADGEKLFTAVTLPCGRVVHNRLVKAPMYEHFAPMWGSPPHSGILALYSKWAEGDWGMIITGNVQVAKDHLPLGRDMIVPDELTEETLAPWRALANVIHHGSADSKPSADSRPGSLAVIQLSHGGRQSLNLYSGRPPFAPPLAPSAVPVGSSHQGDEGWLSRLSHWLMLQVPREMTLSDIQHAVGQFVQGARMAAQSGFDGVELHAAHGYLISQFISPKSNFRTDEYSATRDPLHFLRDVVFAIRAPGVVPEDFIVGVKLNSADYASAGDTKEDRALGHVREIGKWGLIDFIEVSGGDYEDPQFIDDVSKFKSTRQVLFESFAEKSMDILKECIPTATNRPPPLVILTGGLNTLPRMASVLAHDHAHLLGIARLSILHPSLPKEVSSAIKARTPAFMADPPAATTLGTPPKSIFSLRALERLVCYVLTLLWAITPGRLPRIIGASASVNWYNIMLRRIAMGKDIDYTIGTIGATLRCYFAGTPYAATEQNEGRVWWMAAAIVGVALGIGLGQVV